MPEFMTLQETANYLRLHPITVSKCAKRGEVPGFRIGKVWRFKRSAIEAYVRGNVVLPDLKIRESGRR